ncbi:hypothetical protein NC651_012201 [Populus alba x Populus x berolinensis]|nr:hypothetical protein NC651_012201 [Populus alba x Populus x berolinensis]
MWATTRFAQVELSANGEEQNPYKSLAINHVLNSKELSQGRAFSTETSTTDRFQKISISYSLPSPNGQPAKVAWNLKVTVNWRDDGSSRPAAQNINSGTFRGLIAAIPVVGLLILRDPFAVALQMVQELKPQQQRELIDFLIYRLDSLASRMKSSTDIWAYLLWVPLNAKAKLAGLTGRFHSENFGPARRGRQWKSRVSSNNI